MNDSDLKEMLFSLYENIKRESSGRKQVVSTIGIEIESIGKTRSQVADILKRIPGNLGNYFKVHRDGSSEINTYIVSNGVFLDKQIYVSSHTKAAENLLSYSYSKNQTGYELISIPMSIEMAELVLKSLLPSLQANGDFTSDRCATHIHVGGIENLKFLKNCLKLGLWFDEVFYSLAHLDGKKFRGHVNNAIYARPLQNGPYFKYDDEYYQTLNYNDALEASSVSEFFACYGIDIDGELYKYHPARYFSINLYSIPRIGTVEFRHFNQSFNASSIVAVAKLCQLFVEICIKISPKLLNKYEFGNVFVTKYADYYIGKLHELISLGEILECEYKLKQEDIFILENIIHGYSGIGIEDKEIFTHCKEFSIPSYCFDICDFKLSKGVPEFDGHIDIHNIKYQSIIE